MDAGAAAGSPVTPVSRDEIVFLQARWPSANSCLVMSDPPVLVDTGYHTELARLEAALAAHGVRLRDIGLIVNTHSHSDHIGGNSALQARSGAPIAMRRTDASSAPIWSRRGRRERWSGAP